MGQIEIFQFRLYDIDGDEMTKSTRWGTREGISRIGGVVIEGTGLMVDPRHLSGDLPDVTKQDFLPPASTAIHHE